MLAFGAIEMVRVCFDCVLEIKWRKRHGGWRRAGAGREAIRILKPGQFMSVVFGNSSGRIWGLVQRAIRDAGFKAATVHVAILDKGQRSVNRLNSGSESVVTVDLILTVQKPHRAEAANDAHDFRNGDTQQLIAQVVDRLSPEEVANPSHVYARILREAIGQHFVLDHLHLGDVLVALRSAGYTIDPKTGRLSFAPNITLAKEPRLKRAAGGRK